MSGDLRRLPDVVKGKVIKTNHKKAPVVAKPEMMNPFAEFNGSFKDVDAVPANPIDVLKVLELSENMEGVSLEAGLCTSRKGREETDLSFKIDKKIQLSAPTKQLFPG
ncbi:hypothetical protein F2P81_010024 [Scophthalmus maximus]|uniref:Uncharacterized protein n=1 Tax=Scophthalmus maximus TaxID=52904 RepID=A0A6A4SZA8_SCOMX|nr:hypothetical protein F2P81_010024 [Scophthalmus maximus]